MTADYEWVAEVQDKDGDIVNFVHADTYKLIRERAARLTVPEGGCLDFALVRTDDAGRSWAYMDHGHLPSIMVDAGFMLVGRTPRKFRRQVERWIKS